MKGVGLNLFMLIIGVEMHGRLIEPPARTSAWRFGFDTPAMYDDHETNCGGFDRHWEDNGGKCGICGDPWDTPSPRDGEMGGKYGRGVIVKRYRTGQLVKVIVHVTANHLGYFEFRVCPSRSTWPVTQDCLDRGLLRNSRGKTRHFIGNNTGTHSIQVMETVLYPRISSLFDRFCYPLV